MQILISPRFQSQNQFSLPHSSAEGWHSVNQTKGRIEFPAPASAFKFPIETAVIWQQAVWRCHFAALWTTESQYKKNPNREMSEKSSSGQRKPQHNLIRPTRKSSWRQCSTKHQVPYNPVPYCPSVCLLMVTVGNAEQALLSTLVTKLFQRMVKYDSALMYDLESLYY